jgi:chorismate lyase
VKTLAKHPSPRAVWLPKPASSGVYRHWLVDAGSLTRRLQSRCKAFSVKKVCQQRGRALRDEAQLLGMRAHENALFREVFLCCGDRPLVFAHSVLPRRSLRGAWHGLGRLGERPLGAALFANPVVVRTPLTYRKLMPSHVLYRRAAELLKNKPPCLWARRSVFSLRAGSIMVTEVFLPGVLEL